MHTSTKGHGEMEARTLLCVKMNNNYKKKLRYIPVHLWEVVCERAVSGNSEYLINQSSKLRVANKRRESVFYNSFDFK